MRRRQAGLVIGMVLLVILVVLAVVVPWFRPDPVATDYAAKLAGPSWDHPLGTDEAGRDVLARLAAGARISLGSAVLVGVVGAVVGLIIGLFAVLAGGVIDSAVSRVVDVVLAVPQLLLALALVGMLGPGLPNLIMAMALAAWAPMARYARVIGSAQLRQPYVTAARLAGVGRVRLLVRHVLPTTATGVLSVATLGLAEVIIGLAGLSFLGLGVNPPTAEWGQLVADGRIHIARAPWLVLAPAAAIMISVACVSLLSDAFGEKS